MGGHIDWRDHDGDPDLAYEATADRHHGLLKRAIGLRSSFDPWEPRPVFRGERDERSRGFKSEEAT